MSGLDNGHNGHGHATYRQGMWYLYAMVHSVEVHWVTLHARTHP